MMLTFKQPLNVIDAIADTLPAHIIDKLSDRIKTYEIELEAEVDSDGALDIKPEIDAGQMADLLVKVSWAISPFIVGCLPRIHDALCSEIKLIAESFGAQEAALAVIHSD